MNGVWHWGTHNVGVHNPSPVTSSTSRAEECGGSLMVQYTQLPRQDALSLCADDAVQMGESAWNTVDRGEFFNLGALGGPHGFQDVHAFLGSNESLFPFSNWAPPSSQGLLTGAVPGPTCTSIIPNIASETTTNVGAIPLPLHRTTLQPGGGDSCERKDGDCYAFSKMALSSYSDESWHQEQLCGWGTPTMSALSTYHADPSNSATFFGHQDGVQRATNYYDISQSCYPNAEAVIPAQFIPPAIPVQATVASVPAGHLAQGDSGPFGGGASAVFTSASLVGSLVTANIAGSPSEASPTHPLSTQFINSATSSSLQQTFSDLRPCPWKDDQGGICGEFVGRVCQDHLTTAHGIVNISGATLVTCGACGLQVKRESLLRHFREVDLGFRRPR
ncbi:hypothetical protein M404DRAFT_337192 [Pisolithus tinctorius Marx 270]|uniref:Uncharacterized protein n=1 Tax=Pisolithus tinctorius Marx 270 TaxID=870435 RepID=A0A0C3ID40_PISTI|nr:hypothetical protein M404DRAFT_337192 [Pisolithus tinctorius Marx 270]